jgi:hypothetical protein
MKQLLTEWRNFIDESLAKDVERYDLVLELYDHIVEEVSSAKKAYGTDYSYDSYGAWIEPILKKSKEDGNLYWHGVKLRVSTRQFPEHLKRLFKTTLPKKDGEEVNIEGGHFTINFLSSDEGFGGEYIPPFSTDDKGKLEADIYVYNCNDFKNIKNLKKELLVTSQNKRNIVLHELSHMIDDLSLLGHKTFRKAFGDRKSEEEIEKYHNKGYYNIGIELNAKWSEVFDMMKGIIYSDYKEPESYYKATFEQWLQYLKPKMFFDKMSLPKQRKFITRLYEYYENGPYKAPDRVINFEVDRIVDSYMNSIKTILADMPRSATPEEIAKEISLEYNGHNNTLDLREDRAQMYYYYPNSPRPYSKENSDIILQKAKTIIQTKIDSTLKTIKQKKDKK